jgi:small subunit ribosomal protein S9
MSASSTFFQGTGRRKTSVARVRITPATKQSIKINDQDIASYFKTVDLQTKAVAAIASDIVKDQKFDITVIVRGGGTSSQAEAVRHGISRALESYDGTLRSVLKKAGYLTRDQRAKERRKFGLKKARKAPQWSKR